MLIARPCHTSEEIADFINTYGELLEGWGIVEVTPPVIVLYVQEGREEEARKVRDELKRLQEMEVKREVLPSDSGKSVFTSTDVRDHSPLEAGSPPPASLFKQENPDDKEV